MTAIPFTKLEGIGNDYIYVDAAAHPIDDPPELARRMADRHYGVGADGLILVLPPNDAAADVRMRMFNADGSEAEMCGNGIRGLCKLVVDRGWSDRRPLRVATGAGVLELDYERGADGRVRRVTVDLGVPILDRKAIPVELDGEGPVVDAPAGDLLPVSPPGWSEACGLDPRLTCVSMGNPHAVLFCEDVQRVPLAEVGPALERHPVFPRRVNVHFVQVHDRSEVTMVTWERGSGITLACGTGATAVCVAGALTGRTGRRILAHLPGGDLELAWDEATDHVRKTGPAREVFTGTWEMQP